MRSKFKESKPGVQRNATETTGAWAGTIIPQTPDRQTFSQVVGTFMIPNVFIPPASWFPDGKVQDNGYEVDLWVGMDVNQKTQGDLNFGISVGISSYVGIQDGMIKGWTKVSPDFNPTRRDAHQHCFPIRIEDHGNAATAS